MPNHCSAPGCRINYRGEPYSTPVTPVFKLPTASPELRIQWFNALHRDDTGDFKSIYVCLNHFKHYRYHPVDRVMQADGTFTETIRARPRLCQNAVPSILPGCRSYLYSKQLSRPTRFIRETKDV